ncbi:hypothetical protein PVAP13_6KG105935 [Panicum virgatum]|uniref:Uncharacterized protein n=1 Tax=Panicum virgatum TaxID=38727 RepID=A0A8T0RB93_PANVG|nr:hypothetical protein PVAP13_6KG105935 [Panicum virgatum]
MAHRPAGAVTIGWTQHHVMSSHCRPTLPFYPRRRHRAAASSLFGASSFPRPPSRAAAGTAPHFLLARPSSGWLGIASQSLPAGADFQLGFSPPPPHFAATGLRLRAGGRLPPPAEACPFRLDADWYAPRGLAGPRNLVTGTTAALRRDLRPFWGHDFRPLCPDPV